MSNNKGIQIIRPLEVPSITAYTPGYYTDPATGIRYYFNGTTWFRSNGLLLTPLSVAPFTLINKGAWTGVKPVIGIGESFRVTCQYTYQGPASTGVRRYAAWGVYGTGGFDEKVTSITTANHTLATSPFTYTFTADFVAPDNMADNWTSLYFKIDSGTPSIPEMGAIYTDCLQAITAATVTDAVITGVAKL